MTKYLQVDAISKTYSSQGKDEEVFSELTFSLARGEFLGICGKSGTGKTTLLRIISGLLQPDRGSVLIEGQNPRNHYPKIGFVSQEYSKSLFSWFRVDTNIALSLISTGLNKKERYKIANFWLTEVGLINSARKFPWQLSGGMQQRVAIARALAPNPKLLCLDEPFGALDAHTRSELQDLVLALSEKHSVTCVLVTHDLDEAIYMSDKVLVLPGGGKPIRWLEVPLGKPRHQEKTRSTSMYLELRRALHEEIFQE